MDIVGNMYLAIHRARLSSADGCNSCVVNKDDIVFSIYAQKEDVSLLESSYNSTFFLHSTHGIVKAYHFGDFEKVWKAWFRRI